MSAGQYILAHDLGTSGNKATLFSLGGKLEGSVVRDYPIYYPRDGWVEQDADDWWKAVCDSTKILLEKTGTAPSEIACVSFSATMMGCLIVDKDGRPLRNMLIWADTRAAKQEKFMLDAVDIEKGYRITGHRLSASYSAAKLMWIRDNEPELYGKAAHMLHTKEYIILKLTGEAVTEYSDASSTNLLDIGEKKWSDELLDAFGIRHNLLPDLHPSTHVAGRVTTEAAGLCGLMEGTPVVIGGGDGSCACVGAGVVREGKAYNVVGSSSWISMAAREPYFDPGMRTFNWVHLDENLYTPCGTMQAAGYSYQWFRDALCGEESYAGKIAGTSAYKLIDGQVNESQPGAGGLLFLPYLLGERSPLWDHNARGAFVGLGISSRKGDMARAVLEGVAFNLRMILEILGNYTKVGDLVMIGGGTKGETWLQILADVWRHPLMVPQYLEEATSFGAAVCGGIGIGAYPDFLVAEKFNPPVKVIEPDERKSDIYDKLYAIFRDAYTQLKPIYKSLADFVR
ncbi:MAG: FGGY-family carbohydrate kinase [Synergistaceae bacterium]|jgi:xylulokinase|nr:FGGY-family carbohydrate kinase [Synergistaceae bacterium]